MKDFCEFKQKSTGLKWNPLHLQKSARSVADYSVANNYSNYQLPTKVDWRRTFVVTEVKDQGNCGSCWAFASVAAIESHNALLNGKLIALSEQNLVDCSNKQGNKGCEGGFMDGAYLYVVENGGLDTEESYPYEAQDLTCRFKRETVGATMTAYVNIMGGENAMKMVVASKGPVSVAVSVSFLWQFYK